MESPDALHTLLESSNLLSYKSALLEQGADDVDQLVELTAEEFQQLCAMIGMDKKPFHVMRLKKALERKPKTSTIQIPLGQTTPTRELSPPLYSLPAVTPSNSQVLTAPQLISNSTSQPNQTSTPTQSWGPPPLLKPVEEVPPPQIPHNSSKQFFLPPYLLTDSNSSDFSPLVDYHTPIQYTLEKPPCGPKTWDDKRKAIIRRFASIHHKDVDKHHKQVLSPFEEHTNEAAYQLCLRDPTLLVRRDELFLLAKRAVKQGYIYHHHDEALSVASIAPVIGQKRSLDSLGSTSQQDFIAMPQTKRQFNDKNQKLSTQERLRRMNTLQAEMEANVAFQRVKIVAMDEAKRRGDVATSCALEEHIGTLQAELTQLEGAYNLLRRKQNRSDRYFRIKSKKKVTDERNTHSDSGSAHDQFSPIEAVVLSPSEDVHFHSQEDTELPASNGSEGTNSKARPNKRKATPKKLKSERNSASSEDPSESEIKNLVDNVSNATDQVNSILSREEVNW